MKVIINAKPKEIAELLNTLHPHPVDQRANPLDKLFDAMMKSALKDAENDLLNGTSDKEPSGISTDLETPAPAPIYGVSGLYSPSPELTRTDDVVGMTFSINRDTGL